MNGVVHLFFLNCCFLINALFFSACQDFFLIFFLGENDCAAVRLRKLRQLTDANGLPSLGGSPSPLTAQNLRSFAEQFGFGSVNPADKNGRNKFSFCQKKTVKYAVLSARLNFNTLRYFPPAGSKGIRLFQSSSSVLRQLPKNGGKKSTDAFPPVFRQFRLNRKEAVHNLHA